jgi:radical SAM modification target selenobiotic family peptide
MVVRAMVVILQSQIHGGYMKSKGMKKLLAGMGIAGLISAGGISTPSGALAAGSG